MVSENHKRTKMYVYEEPREVKFIETESKMTVPKGLGQRGIETRCLMDTEFQVGKMKKLWR